MTERKVYAPVEMRKRDARQAERLAEYNKSVEAFRELLKQQLADNESNAETYSPQIQQQIRSALSMVSVVIGCHYVQSIQATDCTDDKEQVFKEFAELKEVIAPLQREFNEKRNTNKIFAGIKGKILATIGSITAFLVMFSTAITLLDKLQ